jgi:hypothetical protein
MQSASGHDLYLAPPPVGDRALPTTRRAVATLTGMRMRTRLRRCAEVPLRLAALAVLGIAWWLRARRTGSEGHRADGR